MIGYKVCGIKEDGGWRSYIMGLSYAIGSTTTPRSSDGPLAVFDTPGEAVAFVNDDSGDPTYCVLLEVEYEPSEHNALWEYSLGAEYRSEVRHLPIGTLFADSVTPLRVVPTHIVSLNIGAYSKEWRLGEEEAT